MSKKNTKSDSGTRKTAATKKAQVNVVDDTSTHFTHDELIYMAKVITGFLEADISRFIAHYDDDGEPFFYVNQLKKICVSNDRVLTIDLLSSNMIPELEDSFTLARYVQNYIRTESPSPRVAEILVNWFNEFYAPRIEKLPSIYWKLQSSEAWEWLDKEARSAGITAYDWVRMQVLGKRDPLLDKFGNKINRIKTSIGFELPCEY